MAKELISNKSVLKLWNYFFQAALEECLFCPDGAAQSVGYLMHVDTVAVLAGKHRAKRGVETEAHESHRQGWEEELGESRQGRESRRSQTGQEGK